MEWREGRPKLKRLGRILSLRRKHSLPRPLNRPIRKIRKRNEACENGRRAHLSLVSLTFPGIPFKLPLK